jgi:integrase
VAWTQVRGSKYRVLARVDGKVKQLGVFDTEAEADTFKHDHEHGSQKIGIGSWGAGLDKIMQGPKGPTLAEFARPLANGNKERTRAIRQRVLAKIEAAPEYAARTLKELEKEPGLTRAFIDGLSGDKGTVIGFLQLVFNQAIREGIVSVSPLKRGRITRPAPKKKDIDPLTIAEVQLLAATAATGSDRAAPNETLALTILIGGYTGLRGGEIGGLRVQDIDTVDCTIHVRQQVSSAGREVIEPKTPASTRRIPVPCSITETITDYIERHPVGDDGLIFHTARGEKVTSESLTKALAPVAKRAGLRHVSEHDLRHACASLLLSLGWPAARIAEQFGHNDGGVLIANTYGHLYKTKNRELADSMQAAIEREASVLKALPAVAS